MLKMLTLTAAVAVVEVFILKPEYFLEVILEVFKHLVAMGILVLVEAREAE